MKMYLNVEFEVDNAEFDDVDTNVKFAEMLGVIAGKVALGATEASIYDINGNKIGAWDLSKG